MIHLEAPLVILSMVAVVSLAFSSQSDSQPSSKPGGVGGASSKLSSQPAGINTRQPVEHTGDGAPAKHEKYLAQVAEVRAGTRHIDVLFLGDSITEGWIAPTRGLKLFQEHYGPLNGAAFGVGSDHSQNVLWRITHGEVDGLSPKVIVLLIGANQVGSKYTVGNVVDGVATIISTLHRQLPQTKVLVLGVFPEEPSPGDNFYQKIRDINAGLAKLDNGNNVRFLDFGDKLLGPGGKETLELMNDGTHLTPKGYEIWIREMDPLLMEMLGKGPASSPAK